VGVYPTAPVATQGASHRAEIPLTPRVTTRPALNCLHIRGPDVCGLPVHRQRFML